MSKWNVSEINKPAGITWNVLIRDESNNPICSVFLAGWDLKSAQRHARLIADAPNTADERDRLKALVAELVKILGVINGMEHTSLHSRRCPDCRAMAANARIAIAKAKGGD